jgi:methylenetetrahydrofolate reductase (NADPH)
MGLREAIRTRAFALTAELTPPADLGQFVVEARRIGDCVDAVEVPDNPGGQPHLPALVAAAALREAGIDPVLHLAGRDRNRVALQSELLGAAALGIPSLLLMRGRRPPAGLPSPGKAVLEVDATELIASARALADGQAPFGQGLTKRPDFFIGATATVFEPVANWQPHALIAKLNAGAQFVRTQVCMDAAILRRYMKRLVAAQLMHRAHVLVGLAVLPSAGMAARLREGPRGALIPDEALQRLADARDPEATGAQICAELLTEFADIPGVSGAALVPFGGAEAIRVAVAASGLRASATC